MNTPIRMRPAKRTGRRIAVGGCRLALVAAAFLALAWRGVDLVGSDRATLLAGVREEIPGVVELGQELDGFHELLDENGDSRGWVTNTSFPQADRIEPGGMPGVSRVFSGEKQAGIILRSSRMGVGARGFNGVSDVIFALNGETVLGPEFDGAPPDLEVIWQER